MRWCGAARIVSGEPTALTHASSLFPQANVVCVVYDVSEEATIEKVSPQCRPQWQRHSGPWWPWWPLTQPMTSAISHSILGSTGSLL